MSSYYHGAHVPYTSRTHFSPGFLHLRSSAIMTRRKLLTGFAAAGSLGLAGVVGVPAILTALSPLRTAREGEVWSAVGPIERFPVGEVRKANVDVPRFDQARSLREKGVFVWHSDAEGVVVYSRDCTDLGCPITHDPGSNWFFCPCHGGIFATDGTPKAGPPNRPLYRYAIRVRDGILEIDLRSVPPMS